MNAADGMTRPHPFWKTARSRVLAYIGMLIVLMVVVLILFPPRSGDSDPASPLVCDTDSTAKSTNHFENALSDVALQTLDSAPLMLHEAAHDSRFTVLVFCSSTCPCSDGYAGRLRALQDGYGRRGVSFLGIHSSADETADAMKSYVHRTGYPLTVLQDQNATLADLLGATITPEVFVFDSAWTLQYHGRIDDDKTGSAVRDRSLQWALDTLLSGQPLRAREKISRGCAIARTRRAS